MDRRVAGLLSGIERGLTDGTRTTALLQQCVLLGGKARSTQLREWAAAEINGYVDRPVPDYRTIHAAICVDAIVGRMSYTGQEISSISLPDFAREAGIDETLRLTQGLGELEDLASRDRDSINFSLPGASVIARQLDRNSGQSPFQQTHAMYWSVSRSSIHGVVEKIRTTLAEFLVELLDELPEDTTEPSSEAVDRAINVVLQGAHPTVTVNSGRGSRSASTKIEGSTVGDKFENISGSTIVNRSSLSNALNSINSEGRSDEAAALEELEKYISDSGNATAAEYFDGFTEELTRAEPRKTILQSMWDGITKTLPLVASVATIATGIGHIIGSG